MKKDGLKRGYSLRTQLMLRFIAVSLIPVLIVGLFALWCINYFGLQEKAAIERADLQAIRTNLDTELMYARVAGIRAQQSAVIQSILSSDSADAAYPSLFSREYDARVELMGLFNAAKVHSVYIYSNDGCVYTSQPTVVLSYDVLNATNWFQSGIASSASYFWGEAVKINSVWVLPYVRKIVCESGVLGYAVVNLYESVPKSVFMTHGDMYMLANNGEILYCNDKGDIGSNIFKLYSLSDEAISKEGFDVVGGGRYAMVCGNDYGNPSLAKLFVYNNSAIIDRMLLLTSLAEGFCVVICIVLSAMLSSRFIRPLRKIRENVDTMSLGNTGPQLHPRTQDEIGMLMDSFNNLSARLQASLEEIQRINDMRRKAEYRAIELQINPHFLYNTLSLILYLTDAGEPEKVKQVATALSTLFRISVNRGRELVRISEEISHLRCYLDILSIRHQNEFRYVMDVDPAVLEFYTIKIILQPLVENAVQHGIRDNMITNGFVRVTATHHDGRVIFEIADNGDVPQSRIDEMNAVLQGEAVSDDFGIGMRNVHSRIHLFFKEDFGLYYYKRGEFTVAHIEIPVLTEDIYV